MTPPSNPDAGPMTVAAFAFIVAAVVCVLAAILALLAAVGDAPVGKMFMGMVQ